MACRRSRGLSGRFGSSLITFVMSIGATGCAGAAFASGPA
jgi:hypothetical protein